jgi:ABC-type dipeptide/oligopeptide/nickel transport system permease subunit
MSGSEIYGARISIYIVSAGGDGGAGAGPDLVGTVAGYFGGWVDTSC